MPVHRFTTNEEWNAGIEARSDAGYRTLAYDGDLDGGTLQILTQVQEGPKVPVSDAKLSAAKLDDNGDVIRQVTFRSSGNVIIVLAGATAPDVTVSVL